MLGLGERAGNAALEEVAVALGHVAHGRTGVDHKRLQGLAQLVAAAARRKIGRGKAIVGSDIFTHESGIHVAALLKDVRTYQALDPASLGRRHRVVIAKHSGVSAIQKKCDEIGVDLDRETAARVLDHVKSRALAEKRPVKRGEFIRLVDRALEEAAAHHAGRSRSRHEPVSIAAAPRLAPSKGLLAADPRGYRLRPAARSGRARHARGGAVLSGRSRLDLASDRASAVGATGANSRRADCRGSRGS